MGVTVLFFGLIVIIGLVALLIGVIVAIVRGNWGIAATLGAVGVVALVAVFAAFFTARVSQRAVVEDRDYINYIEVRDRRRVEQTLARADARGYRFFQGPPDVPTPDITALAAVPPNSPAHDRIEVTGIVSAVYDANTNSQVEQEARLELLESDGADIALRNDAAERLAAYFDTLVSQEQPPTSWLKGLRDDLARISPRARQNLARGAILEFSTPAGSEIITTATVNGQPVHCRVQRWLVDKVSFEHALESSSATAIGRDAPLPRFGRKTRIVLIVALIIVTAVLLRSASRHHASRRGRAGDMS